MATPLGNRCALMLALAGAAIAWAQPEGQPPAPTPVARPAAAGRIVRVFDFEERDRNPGEVPDLWFRRYDAPAAVEGAFPRWNQATLRYTQEGGVARSGAGGVLVPTRGGSTSLALSPGAAPVFQDADYRVSAFVHTRGLTHARAAVLARFLDQDSRPIPASETMSEAVLGENWTEISAELVGRHPQAAWIQIELCVLQPDRLTTDSVVPAAHRVRPQDFSGGAWFDDVVITQLPRIEMATASPANVVIAPDRPELKVLVRDLAGETLTLSLEVRDADGSITDRTERVTDQGVTPISWAPTLPKLGWYQAELVVRGGGRVVGRTRTNFVWLPEPRRDVPPDPRTPERRRFGIIFDSLPPGGLALAEHALRRSGAGAVGVPVWGRDHTQARTAAEAQAMLPAISGLISDWFDVTLSLPGAPESLASALRVDADDPFSVLLHERDAWRPYTQDLFDTFGQRVSSWQIGRSGDDRAFWRPTLGADLRTLREGLSRMLPGPKIVIPGRIDRDWDTGAPVGALALRVPYDVEASGIGEASRSLAARASPLSGPELRMVVEPAPPGTFGVRAGAEHTARQAIEAWAGIGADPRHSLWLESPWVWDSERRLRILPRAELGVWRTLADQLADRRVVGEFPTMDGVRCLILAPAPGSTRGGALVAWNISAPPEVACVAGFLGDAAIRVTDIDGNVTAAPSAAATGARPAGVRVPVGPGPVFIEGVDVPLCRFVSSLAILPPTLESTSREQEREIELENPWPQAIRGVVTILEPGGLDAGERERGWRIVPRASRFALDAGARTRLPVSIGFSAAEEAGPKPFVFEIQLQADITYPPIEVRREVELGLRGLRLDLTAALAGDDVIVEANIGNTGDETMNLNLTAFAPDSPRVKALVNNLPVGNHTVKRFTFAGKRAELVGRRVVVSVQNAETGARLSRSVMIR